MAGEMLVADRMVRLPRLHLDPGVWQEAEDGELHARIVLGTRSLVLTAHAAEAGCDEPDEAQRADIDGRAYVVSAYDA